MCLAAFHSTPLLSRARADADADELRPTTNALVCHRLPRPLGHTQRLMMPSPLSSPPLAAIPETALVAAMPCYAMPRDAVAVTPKHLVTVVSVQLTAVVAMLTLYPVIRVKLHSYADSGVSSHSKILQFLSILIHLHESDYAAHRASRHVLNQLIAQTLGNRCQQPQLRPQPLFKAAPQTRQQFQASPQPSVPRRNLASIQTRSGWLASSRCSRCPR